MPQRIRTYCLDVRNEPVDHIRKPGRLGGGHPFHTVPTRVDAAVLQCNLYNTLPRVRFLITFQVMAFTQVSTNHQNTIRTFFQGMDHQVGTHHPRAHHPHHPKIWGVL